MKYRLYAINKKNGWEWSIDNQGELCTYNNDYMFYECDDFDEMIEKAEKKFLRYNDHPEDWSFELQEVYEPNMNW